MQLFSNQDPFAKYWYQDNVVLIASTGRSGSTVLTDAIDGCFGKKLKIDKTHNLPPDRRFKGKILFIFSNPDLAAESALHMTIKDALFGAYHFQNIESSDQKWLEKISSTTNQTEEDNLLAYDALGCYEHLLQWLHIKTHRANWMNGQILAIKYENLWSDEVRREVNRFLKMNNFSLPPKKERGYSEADLDPREILFRRLYNLGTWGNPHYSAYDAARELWEKAPSVQYLNLN